MNSQQLSALKDGKRGGVLVGRKHSECNAKGECGIKAVVAETGQPIEMQTNEVVITAPAVNSKDTHSFDGKTLTNKQILSKINEQGGGVSFAKGGTVGKYERGGSLTQFATGDHVGWNSEAGPDTGVIETVHTKDFEVNGYTHHADQDHPQYAIKSPSGHIAYHKATAIHKITQDKAEDGIQLFLGGGHVCPCQHKSMEHGGEIEGLSDFENDLLYSLNFSHLRYRIIRDLKHVAGIIKEGYGYVTHGKVGKELHLTNKGVKFIRSMPKRVLNIEQFKKGGVLDEPIELIVNGEKVTTTRKQLEENYKFTVENLRDSMESAQTSLEDATDNLETAKAENAGPLYIKHQEEQIAFYVEKIKEIQGKQERNRATYEGYILQVGDKPKGKIFKGVDFKYENQFVLNKAIEELVDTKKPGDMSPDEKIFLTYYSGYGGLQKFGAEGHGVNDEYYTPDIICKYMWALAYQYGFDFHKNVLEPSCGIGALIKYAPNKAKVTGYDINPYSTKIAKILYPKATINTESFEDQFIYNNQSKRSKIQGLNKFGLVIGNPPYGIYNGLAAGLGEKAYTHAKNYIDYFISRGLDLLESGGLLVYIVGAEVSNGGVPFLAQEKNPAKQAIAEKSTLMDAYRLPNGVFERTNVLTDIIVLKKK